MIEQYTSFVIPADVVGSHWPKADEDKLHGLSAHWSSIGTTLSGQSDSVTVQSRRVFANWSGSGADTASAQLTAVSRFASSTSAASQTVAKGCETAASYVTNTKTGINVVLMQLDNLTKQEIALGLSNPLLIPTSVAHIIDLRKQARAIIAAYYEALTSSMGAISFASVIQPRPNQPRPAGGTGAGGGKAPATGGASGGAGGGTSTGPGGVPAGSSPAAGTGQPSADPWQGGLTDHRDVGIPAPLGDPTALPTTDPAHKPDPDPSSSDSPDLSGHTPGVTGKPVASDVFSGAEDLRSSFGAQPTTGPAPAGTTPSPGTTPPPTGGDNWSGGKPPAPAGSPGGTGAGTAFSTRDITAVVQGKADPNTVGLTPPSSAPSGPPAGSHHPASAGPPSPAATPTETKSYPASSSGSGGGDAGFSGGGHGGGGGGGGGGTVANQPVAPVASAVVGTGAAGVAAPAPAAPPPLLAPAGGTGFMGGGAPSGGAGPAIQIGPGGMSGPVTAMPGGVGGLTPATTGLPAAAAPTPITAGGMPTGNAIPTAPSTGLPQAPTAAAPAASAPAPSTATPAPQAGPGVNASQPLRIETPRPGGGAPTTGAEPTDLAIVSVGAAIATLGLVGAAAQHFAGLWTDLRASSVLRPTGTVLPTQYGREDEVVATLPAGMDTVYQKVLLPGELDQLFAGQIETLRGLVYPFHAVRELHTPAQLYDALGLGYAVTGIAGSDTLAFNRDAETIEVLRCAGLRTDDLVTPVDADVTLPPGTVPVPLVRHHKRPWSGTGEAPGSTSEHLIEEHEVLGYASVAIPHLAEIWRLHADGREEYVSTYNQRNGQWLGDTTPSHQPIGRRIDNGAYATLSDGTVFRTVLLTDRHSVLIAYGVSSPEHFEQVHDGSYRITVDNTDLISLTGVTTIGTWHGLPVQLLHRQGAMLLIDYAGDEPAPAGAAGFLQVAQGQWQPRWVEHSEVTDLQELERPYGLPRAVPVAPAAAGVGA